MNFSHKIPLSKWSRSVHLIMNYYKQFGIPIPTILAVTPKEAIVEYLDGFSLDKQRHINESQIYQVFSTIKLMHSNALELSWLQPNVFQPNYIRSLGNANILSHCDITPGNVIFRGDDLSGIIDWELAGPIDPLFEFCKSCWLFSRHTPHREQSIYSMMDIYGIKSHHEKDIFEMIKIIIYEDIKRIPHTKKHQKAIDWRKADFVWFDNRSR